MLPEPAFFDVGRAEFPVLVGLVDTGEEALALLLLREVEKEFDHAGSVGVEMSLQIRDRAVAIVPKSLCVVGRVRQPLADEKLPVDADDQHLLIIRTVEDADPSALWKIPGR